VFQTTHWSVVLSAAKGDTSQAADALEALCRAYSYPLYAFVRRQGYAPADAEDLTQALFARFLARDYLAAVEPAKGKFRWFLPSAVKRFLITIANEAGPPGGAPVRRRCPLTARRRKSVIASLLREQIAQTVAHGKDLEEEVRDVLGVFAD
jgi:hypothetical protein